MTKPSDPRPHIVNVGYLNSTPFSLVQSLPEIRYSQTSPAACARMLHEGECELALIPIAEFFSFGGYDFLPYGIGAENMVDSVYVVGERPLEDLRTISIDSSSHSSATLLRILLNEQNPRLAAQLRFYRRSPEEAHASVGGSTGALLIGDIALRQTDRFQYRYDLAALWKTITGLPFVFAIWAGKFDKLPAGLLKKVTHSFDEGIDKREILGRAWAEERGFDRELAAQYLRERITYRLDGNMLRGAEEFLARGIRAGLFPGTLRTLVPTTRSNGLPKPSNGTSLPVQLTTDPNRPWSATSRNLDAILTDASDGLRISISEGLLLAKSASLADLGLAADRRRRELHAAPGISYIVDRNINYTNVCNVYCRFCAFYRPPGKKGTKQNGDTYKHGGYLLSKEDIGQKIEETIAAGGIQILLQGGLNPELGIEYYEDLFSWIKERYPINLHALSADEILHIAEVSSLSLDSVFERLIRAGLGSLPGAGAEILVDQVRRRIARLKSPSEKWLDVHRTAHRHGLTSTSTMMFGVQETWLDRLNHMHKLRMLQDETGGFTAFITWPFQPENTNLKQGNTSSTEYLRVQAIARLFLDNIPNIQSSWVTMGPSIGQAALFFGANDFGSVMFEENVVSSAGTTYGMDSPLIERHIREAGFFPWPRDVHYHPVR